MPPVVILDSEIEAAGHPSILQKTGETFNVENDAPLLLLLLGA